MDLLNPKADRPLQLMEEIRAIFVTLPFVQRIRVFGSLARGDWDCWSDIDLLVVTQTRSQFRDAFEALLKQKPIIHRSPFVPKVEPAGGYVLGNVFAGESVFHCLDLNFLTMTEYQSPESLVRFGELTELYCSAIETVVSESGRIYPIEEETADEVRINYGLHFTKKAVKKILRGQSAQDDLRKFSTILRDTMQDYPDDYCAPTGAIGKVAHTYIKIADELLATQ